MSKKITIAKMLTYLDGKKPGEAVGEACNEAECPIQKFYEEFFGYEEAVVYCYDSLDDPNGRFLVHEYVVSHIVNGVEYKHKLPKWANEVIRKIDSNYEGEVNAATLRNIVFSSIK